ncbi:MAG: PhoH family protein [Gammaproteobacteria bacterium]|nr:PhoH family protein [Gammaproteobacteria bacterium]
MPLPPPPKVKADKIIIGKSRKKTEITKIAVVEVLTPTSQVLTDPKKLRKSTEPVGLPVQPISRDTPVASPIRTYVLDTSVLLDDPHCIYYFAPHYLYIPLVVLSELDRLKTGYSDIARNARHVIRALNEFLDTGEDPSLGMSLAPLGGIGNAGKLFFQLNDMESQVINFPFPLEQNDHKILAVASVLAKTQPVTLVTLDLNLRIKSRVLGLDTLYFSGKSTYNAELGLYSGIQRLPLDFWSQCGKNMKVWKEGAVTLYQVPSAQLDKVYPHQFLYLPDENHFLGVVEQVHQTHTIIRTAVDYAQVKNAVWGIYARNNEQNCALNLLMNPDLDLVTLVGTAGSGKTLLALASGLSQVIESKKYNEVIAMRATFNIGEDIGFLPGTEEEKMTPWMGAIEDNLEVLSQASTRQGEWRHSDLRDLMKHKLKIKSINFVRGRTFNNKFILIDEAQNLTVKQLKTLLTRVGQGSKVVCIGNIEQIDAPHLTEGSSGLVAVVEKFRGSSLAGHITLAKGERSRLADFVSQNF